MIEEFFDLRIATIGPGERSPPDAHLVRMEDPPEPEIRRRTRAGWFFKPCFVTYVIPVPESLEEYVHRSFRSRARNKPRKLLREVPRRYRLSVGRNGEGIREFRDLYLRTVVGRPRGKDRLAEHTPGFARGWLGFYLFRRREMVAGVLVQVTHGHLSIAYGAFDPAHRDLDLEHFLILQVLQQSIELRNAVMSLGMDTNRYGHHLSLHLPAYKLRLGFLPMAFDPAGRELIRVQSLKVFDRGLFFYSYDGEGMAGNLFPRGKVDVRPFRHPTAPPIRVHDQPSLRGEG